MGQIISQIFKSFNQTPVASASLAQVHEAYLSSGEKVAVKVWHPWIREQCLGDIKLVRFGIELAYKLFPTFNYRWLAEEFE